VKRLSETGLIDWIRRRTPKDARVTVGIGDDAAVVRGSRRMVLKTDMIVENVHFTRKNSKPEDWGYKAMAVTLSDLAAMGAVPEYALAAVGLPKDLGPADAQAVHRGMEKAMRLANVRLVGGDTCRAERVTIAVFVAGSFKSGKMALRSGARPGDALFVTGRLGGSLASGRHLRPVPRLKESEYLMRRFRVRAMMDLSDGLAKDLRLLCAESGVGAELDARRIPVHPDARGRGVAAALLDGEDFELLFALGPKDAERLERGRGAAGGRMRFTRIGHIVPKQQGFTILSSHGEREKLPPAPDHHFGS